MSISHSPQRQKRAEAPQQANKNKVPCNNKQQAILFTMHRCKIKPCNLLAPHKKRRGGNEEEEEEAMMPSKPIPIPLRRWDPHYYNNDKVAHETRMYDAATWRMYELIATARLRAAADMHYKVSDDHRRKNHMMSRDDHSSTTSSTASTSSQMQHLDDETTRRGMVYSLPERPSVPPSPPSSSSLVDGVFIMDL